MASQRYLRMDNERRPHTPEKIKPAENEVDIRPNGPDASDLRLSVIKGGPLIQTDSLKNPDGHIIINGTAFIFKAPVTVHVQASDQSNQNASPTIDVTVEQAGIAPAKEKPAESYVDENDAEFTPTDIIEQKTPPVECKSPAEVSHSLSNVSDMETVLGDTEYHIPPPGQDMAASLGGMDEEYTPPQNSPKKVKKIDPYVEKKEAIALLAAETDYDPIIRHPLHQRFAHFAKRNSKRCVAHIRKKISEKITVGNVFKTFFYIGGTVVWYGVKSQIGKITICTLLMAIGGCTGVKFFRPPSKHGHLHKNCEGDKNCPEQTPEKTKEAKPAPEQTAPEVKELPPPQPSALIRGVPVRIASARGIGFIAAADFRELQRSA